MVGGSWPLPFIRISQGKAGETEPMSPVNRWHAQTLEGSITCLVTQDRIEP